jgi:hypothetical protein
MKKLLSFFLLIGSLNLLSHEFNPAHLIINQSDNDQSSYAATCIYPFKNILKIFKEPIKRKKDNNFFIKI